MKLEADVQVLDQAIHWIVLLQSGNFSAEQQRALCVWRAADPCNERTFQRLHGELAPLDASPLRALPANQLLDIVHAPSSRRRALGAGLGLLGLTAGGLLLTRVAEFGLALPGDFHTGIGERRTWWLADGSRLDLNAGTIVSVRSPLARVLELKQGELSLQVVQARTQQNCPPLPASDRGSSPLGADCSGPFFLVHSQGVVARLEAGRYLLRREQQRTRLVTFEHSARLYGVAGQERQVAAWRSLSFDPRRLYSDNPTSNMESAWLNGWLEVRGQSLMHVVEALRPYHRGFLQITEEAAELRVSGRFPLDDLPRSLDLLAGSLPIRVLRRPFWIRIYTA